MMTTTETERPARALIVSRDFVATKQISDVIHQYDMLVEVSVDISTAWEKLSRRKYEAVLLDSSL